MKKRYTVTLFVFGTLLLFQGTLLAQEWFSGPLAGPPATPTQSGSSSTNNPANYNVSADELDSDWNHTSGEVITRFAVDFTAFAGLQEGQMDWSEDLVIGLSGGAGYFPIDMLSTDVDLSTALRFTEEGAEVNDFIITPGSRLYPLSEVFVRVGLPIVVTDPFSINGLAGLGYEIPVGDGTNLIGEASVTYPITEEGEGTVVLGGGTTLSF